MDNSEQPNFLRNTIIVAIISLSVLFMTGVLFLKKKKVIPNIQKEQLEVKIPNTIKNETTQNTKQQLQTKAIEIKDNIKETANSIKEKTTSTLNKIQELNTSPLEQTIKHKIKQAETKIEEAREQGKLMEKPLTPLQEKSANLVEAIAKRDLEQYNKKSLEDLVENKVIEIKKDLEKQEEILEKANQANIQYKESDEKVLKAIEEKRKAAQETLNKIKVTHDAIRKAQAETQAAENIIKREIEPTTNTKEKSSAIPVVEENTPVIQYNKESLKENVEKKEEKNPSSKNTNNDLRDDEEDDFERFISDYIDSQNNKIDEEA